MAVAWAFVLAIRLAPSATRWVATTAPVSIPRIITNGDKYRQRLYDPGESDEALSALLSDASDSVVAVTTYSAPFELRRFHVEWSRTSGGAIPDDQAVATFHAIKLSGGTPTDAWVAGDFAAFESALTAFWNTIKPHYHTSVILDRVKAYKAGPAISPPQPPVYDSGTPNVAGTASTGSFPPQCAITVTERAGTKPHWGRFYLPAPSFQSPASVMSGTSAGRLSTAFQTLIADAADTFYEACRTANIPLVVYRAPLPVRETKAGLELPARPGTAWTVDTIQVDDVFDVIRSRRWDMPLLRLQRGIGA